MWWYGTAGEATWRGGTRSKRTDNTTTAYFMSAKLQSANNRKDKVTGRREIYIILIR